MLLRMRNTYVGCLLSFSICICLLLFSAQYAFATSPYQIKIPKQFGKVSERYRGKNDTVIIHVQDAHTSYEAQENIAHIIESLVSGGVVDTVAVEGAQGDISVDDFRLFPEHTVRRSIASTMVAHGYLTGAELAAVGMDDPVDLYGVENMKIYERNLDKFRLVMSRREDIIRELDSIEEILRDLKECMYSPEMKVLDAAVEKYYHDNNGFVDIAKYLIESAVTHNIDLYQFVNISLLMESLQSVSPQSVEKAALINEERSAVIMALLKRSREEKLTAILHKIEEKSTAPSEEKQMVLDSFLLKQLRGHGLPEADFRHFVERAQFAEKFGRVDTYALLDEIDGLIKKLFQVFAGDEAGVSELVALSVNARLMENLVELRVVPSQVEEYHADAAAFSSVRYLNFLRTYTKRYDISYHPSSSIVLIDDVLSIASEFYRYAEARSAILVNKTVDRIEDTNAEAIVLVAGGYHTDSMVEEIKKKGFSYLVVAPRIEQLEMSVPYLDRMMNVRTTAELRFESAFNTIVNKLLCYKYEPLKNVVNDLYVANAAAAEVAQYHFRNSEKKLPLSSLESAVLHSQRLLSLMASLKLGDEKTVYVVQHADGKGYSIISEAQEVRAYFPNDGRSVAGADTESLITAISPDEIAEMLARDSHATLHDIRQSLLFEGVSHVVQSPQETSPEECARQFKGALRGIEQNLFSQEECDQAITTFRLALLDTGFRETKACTAALTIDVIKAMGNDNVEEGLQVLSQMLMRKNAYRNEHNKLFSELVESADVKHTVVVVCETVDEKREAENMLQKTFYNVVVMTKDDIVEQASVTKKRPGKVALVDMLSADTRFANLVFAALDTETKKDSRIAEDDSRVVTFSADALEKYVSATAEIKTNVVDLLLAAAHDPQVNVVELFLKQLKDMSITIIEHVQEAMKRLSTSKMFTRSA